MILSRSVDGLYRKLLFPIWNVECAAVTAAVVLFGIGFARALLHVSTRKQDNEGRGRTKDTAGQRRIVPY